MAANQQKIGVDSRKRPLPSSADLTVPPNKKIPKPTAKEQLKLQREKELLYQRSALESRTPFYLQPRIQFPNLPAVIRPPSTATAAATPKPYSTNLGSPAFYPYLPTPSTPGSTISVKPYSVSDLVSSSSDKRAASPKAPLTTVPSSPYSSFGPPNAGRPSSVTSNTFSPWSPFHGNLISGLPTPPSNESMLNRVESTDDPQNAADKQKSSGIQYPASLNRGTPVGSPFVYMYNSPGASGGAVPPMVLLRSPSGGPTSVRSVPSVSSSSGCSSMSEGSVIDQRSITQPSSMQRIAPTEYHVGIKVPNPPSTDDSCGSDGLATPTPDSDDDDDDDVDVEIVDCDKSTVQPPMSCSAPTPSSVTVCSPLSVQSLVGSTGSRNQFKQHQTNQVPLQHLREDQYYTQLHHAHQHPRPITATHSHMMSPISSRDSSPEPELDNSDDVSLPSNKMSVPDTPVNGDDVFSLVPGRLSLLSATQKYKITVDEVRRRLSSPECLNASVLGGILRRAKSKNGGHHLRQNLEEKGLSLPPGRRKQTDITLFTSLVEGEALHLANDHRRICQNFFPHHELAQIIGQQHANSPQNQERQRMVEGARVLLSEFQAMVDAVGRPSNLSPNDPSNPYPGLTNFNLISHGFGNPSISTAVSVIQNYLLELSKIYETANSTGDRPPFDAGSNNNGMAAVLPPKHPVVMGNSSSNNSGGNHSNRLHGYRQLPINLLKREPKEM